MLVKAKTFRIQANDLRAPPYIHRYIFEGKNGWRIQPTGYIKEFCDDDFGGPEQSLEVAKGAISVLSKLSDSDLMQLFDPSVRVSVRSNGDMQIVLQLTKGLKSVQPCTLVSPYRLSAQTIQSLGEAWVGLKVYDFQIKQAPGWFPLSCRAQAFQTWKRALLDCVKTSLADH